MELCWSASSNNTLIYSEEGMGGGGGAGRSWSPLHWYPKEVGIPVSFLGQDKVRHGQE